LKDWQAFGIPYVAINSNAELEAKLSKVINKNGFALCEVFVSIQQKFEPKSATKRLPDGRLISPPLEDLAPFLSREELKENMYIPLIGEE
jgi:acetolactate synthase-1/2/3 large subunit